MGLFSKVSKAIKGGAKNITKGAKKIGSESSKAWKKTLDEGGAALVVLSPTMIGPTAATLSKTVRRGFFDGISSQMGTAGDLIDETQKTVPKAKALIDKAKTLAQSAQEVAGSLGVSIPGLDMLGAGVGAAPQGSLFTPEPTTITGNGGDDNTMIYLAIGAVVLVGVFLYMRKS